MGLIPWLKTRPISHFCTWCHLYHQYYKTHPICNIHSIGLIMVQEGKEEGREGDRKIYLSVGLSYQNFIVCSPWPFRIESLKRQLITSSHYHSYGEEQAEILSPLNLTMSRVQINSQEASARLSVFYVLMPLLKIHLLPKYCLELRVDIFSEKNS